MNGSIDSARLYDVIVVGGGPAGLTAAIYLARARYRVLVVEKDRFGGQITITSEVVNYPGIKSISGTELTDGMRRQAQDFGAEFMLTEVTSLSLDGDIKTVRTGRGDLYCFGVLLATGAHPRTVGFVGEEEFRGRGVAYCATCDGEFFTGKDVFVIGGGFAAAEESVFLTKFARCVTILMITDDFTCAQATAQPARDHERITVVTNVSVEEVAGDGGLNYIRYRNTNTGEVTEFRADAGESFGVFVFAGYEPATGIARGIAELNEQGYIITDRSQRTNVPGLYAAGDVCVKPLRQVVTAVGEGALAATELERYAASLQVSTGMIPKRPQPGANEVTKSSELFDEAMLSQLNAVFERMQSPLTLRLYIDDSPLGAELEQYIGALASLTDKISLEKSDEVVDSMPCVRIYRQSGEYAGLAFHGVPGGHEFTSFVLGLYNAAGPGQAIDDETRRRILDINSPVAMRVLVSLSCTMCPELVTAAQKMASMSDNISAEVYDINHFFDLRERYNVMSVPCLVLNDEHIAFGRKNVSQLVEWVASHVG